MYDYLIVGAGLFGSVFAHEAKARGKKCLVIDRRAHIGGNAYTEKVEGITVHRYGAHIFHTSNKKVWDYMNGFAKFNRFVNSPLACFNGELYNLPFNMNTFAKLWGIKTPEEARAKLAEQVRAADISEPKNLEEQALSTLGADIYEKFIKGYTEKQWGRECKDLPPFILKRLPVRFTYDNNYFNDAYQGIPEGGYTPLIRKLLDGVEVRLNCPYGDDLKNIAEKIIYTGPLDELFGYRLGRLEYRTLKFCTRVIDAPDFQGNAVVNYTSRDVPYTRITEHKYFEFGTQPKTVITEEYPEEWSAGREPLYPVNDAVNEALSARYKALADKADIIYGGRLADYKYLDMDKAVENALGLAAKVLK